MMETNMNNIYTIGYANKTIEDFIEQLRRYQINALVDVRSVPFSAYFHDYNQDRLRHYLQQADIHYLDFGAQLGPRSKDPAHYDADNQVQFSRLSQSEAFHAGVLRIKAGLKKGYRIAMMCAEKDPAVCHRSLLISHSLLDEHALQVEHITHDGDIETEAQLRQRLMVLNDVNKDFFRSEAECLLDAYKLQVKKYAYRKPK